MKQSGERPAAPEVNDAGVPAELKGLARWVCWRYAWRAGKWAKAPLNVRTGRWANANDAEAQAGFEEALDYHRRHPGVGVGFVFREGDPFTGIDLDDCRDPAGGTLLPWAEEVVRELDTYAEVSPSGTGVKLFVRGKVPPGSRKKKGDVEVYSAGQYFTVTGDRLPGTPAAAEDRQAQLLRLHLRVFGDAGLAQDAALTPCPLTDDEVIARARNAKNGHKFSRLWDGDLAGAGSASEGDLALMNLLAYWTGGDAARMESLFGKSALGERKKWVERADYRKMTIDKAVAGWRQFSPREGQAGPRLTRGAKLRQSSQETTGGVRSCIHEHAGRREEDLVEQGRGMAADLAAGLGRTPCWEASFALARRLRRLADDRPERFEPAVAEFCKLSGRDMDELWYAYLSCWTKVRMAEGDDVFAWAAKMAEDEPLQFNPALRPLFDRVGSIAWHLAGLTYPDPFWLPRERLAPLLNVSAMTVSNIISLLVKEGVLACVDADYSYAAAKAKEYAFVGKPLGEGGAGG
jgi:putative DNA primase/helicase